MQLGSRHRAVKDASLIVQATQVARIGVKNYKAALSTIRIRKVKGTHRGAQILVNVRTAVDPVYVFVPATIGEVAVWDDLCGEYPACGCGGKVWLKLIPIIKQCSMMSFGFLTRLHVQIPRCPIPVRKSRAGM